MAGRKDLSSPIDIPRKKDIQPTRNDNFIVGHPKVFLRQQLLAQFSNPITSLRKKNLDPKELLSHEKFLRRREKINLLLFNVKPSDPINNPQQDDNLIFKFKS